MASEHLWDAATVPAITDPPHVRRLRARLKRALQRSELSAHPERHSAECEAIYREILLSVAGALPATREGAR